MAKLNGVRRISTSSAGTVSTSIVIAVSKGPAVMFNKWVLPTITLRAGISSAAPSGNA